MRRRRHAVAVLGLVVLIQDPSVQADFLDGTPDNAAPLLREAFRALPELTETEKGWLDQPRTVPSSSENQILARRLEPSMRLLREAVGKSDASWDLPFEEEGLKTTMPHLLEVRKLTQMAHHHARAQLPDRPTGFVEDEVAILAAARHVGREGPLVAVLVEYAVESQALDQLARQLTDLPQGVLDVLATELERLPDGGTLDAALHMDKAIGIDRLLRRIRSALHQQPTHAGKAQAPSSLLANEFRVCSIVRMGERSMRIGLEERDGTTFLLSLGQRKRGVQLVSLDYAREEAVLLKDGQAHTLLLTSRTFIPLDLEITREEILRQFPDDLSEEVLAFAGNEPGTVMDMLKETEEDLDQMIAALSLPMEEFEAWVRTWESEEDARNPLSRALLPAIGKARKLEEKSQLRRQMLVSAIRMVREGVPGVPAESDASAPFDIVQTASGFDLVSSFEVNGEPVTLKVGNE